MFTESYPPIRKANVSKCINDLDHNSRVKYPSQLTFPCVFVIYMLGRGGGDAFVSVCLQPGGKRVRRAEAIPIIWSGWRLLMPPGQVAE
jgi:hypothetical protein